jgi:hypothetical protein
MARGDSHGSACVTISSRADWTCLSPDFPGQRHSAYRMIDESYDHVFTSCDLPQDGLQRGGSYFDAVLTELRHKLPSALHAARRLVAGPGFEPGTFRL